MKRKILIAIDNDFIREAYEEVFKKEDFQIFATKDGREALRLTKTEKPDVVLADVLLSKINAFELLDELKKDKVASQIPVIVFAQIERTVDKNKALELEAKDFITAAGVSPIEVIRKVKIILGEQKSYKVNFQKTSPGIKDLADNLGYNSLKCSKCGEDLVMYLMRDLSIGEKHFIVSFICPKCNK